MKKLTKAARNYAKKLEGYAIEHNKAAIGYYRNKCYINALMELAGANMATNKKLTILNHGQEVKVYEEDTIELLTYLNKINYKDEDTFFINMFYVRAHECI